MKEKTVVIFVVMLLVATILPTTMATESEQQTRSSFDGMALCRVSIKGRGTEYLLMDSFVFGSGKCAFMIIDLKKDGYVELFSLIDPSNPVILEGRHVISLFGFAGEYSHLLKIRVDGFAFFAIWS